MNRCRGLELLLDLVVVATRRWGLEMIGFELLNQARNAARVDSAQIRVL
jgi:hypothetical protein